MGLRTGEMEVTEGPLHFRFFPGAGLWPRDRRIHGQADRLEPQGRVRQDPGHMLTTHVPVHTPHKVTDSPLPLHKYPWDTDIHTTGSPPNTSTYIGNKMLSLSTLIMFSFIF